MTVLVEKPITHVATSNVMAALTTIQLTKAEDQSMASNQAQQCQCIYSIDPMQVTQGCSQGGFVGGGGGVVGLWPWIMHVLNPEE